MENTIKDLTPDIEKTINLINSCKNKESLVAIWANVPPTLKTNEDIVLAKDNQLSKYEDPTI
jgi:hypothetical protein